MLGRWPVRAGVGLGVAIAATLVLRPATAAAMNPVRGSVVAEVERHIGERLSGPHPDVDLALDAWAAGAVDLGAVRTDIARSAPTELGDHAALHLVEDTCGALLTVPPDQPRPGDLVAYRGDGAVDAPWRVGVFLTTVEVAVLDPSGSRLVTVPRDALLSGVDPAVLRARPESVTVCRFRAALMPGGVDDGASGPGRVMLLDPHTADVRLDWSYAHPRDANRSAGHILGSLLRPVGAVLGGAVAMAGGLLVTAAHGLTRLPVAGTLLAAAGGVAVRVLGSTFDGERLHRVLTVAMVAALGAAAVVSGGLLPLAAAAVAAAALASRAARVPVLGSLGDALWSATSFVVSTLTGVDDSRRVRLGGVLLALAADAMVAVRPLAALPRVAGLPAALTPGATAAGRFAAVLRPVAVVVRPLGRGLHGVLRAAADLSDLAGLRPRAWLGALSATRRGAWLAEGAAGDPAAVHVAGGLAARAADLVALGWRPQSSLVSDLTTHLHDGGEVLAEALRSGSPRLRAVAAGVLRTDPEAAARVLRAALVHVDRTAPALRRLDELSHLHSGGRTVAGLVAGQAPTPAVDAMPDRVDVPGPACPSPAT